MGKTGVHRELLGAAVMTAVAIFAALVLAVLAAGCGGGREPAAALRASGPGTLPELSAVLAELELLPAPPDADAAVFSLLKAELHRQLTARGKLVCTPPPRAVTDLHEVETPLEEPPIIAWSSSFFVADGDLSGVVDIMDINPLAAWFGAVTAETPQATVADYNRDGVVNISDVTPLAMNFGQDVAGFRVQIAPADGPFADAVFVAWGEQLEEPDGSGFAVFQYAFAAEELPEDESMYVRVVPHDAAEVPGTPSEPIGVLLPPPPPPPVFELTDMLVRISGSRNTDNRAFNAFFNTEYYTDSPSGRETWGEAPANAHLHIVLADVAYEWDGSSYGFGAALPDNLPPEQFAAIMAVLQDCMEYAVSTVPSFPEPDAWLPDEVQPELGLAGTLWANDPGELLISALMVDNEYTKGSSTLSLTVEFSIVEDPNAPEIHDFTPLEAPQNELANVLVRLDWGEDESGTEVPSLLQLCLSSGQPVATLLPDDPVETPDPPSQAGRYTLTRVADNPDYTTVINAWVNAEMLPLGDYYWLVAEDAGGFERRSSLKKPGYPLTVLAPVWDTMMTWPEHTFCTEDAAQPYLYFYPSDPIIRRNPNVHPGSGAPPSPVVDDPVAYADIIKAGSGQWNIQYGYSAPGFPRIHYRWGMEPPETISEADGMMTVFYFQRWMLAGAVADLWDPGEGQVAFALFDQSGDYMGYCATRQAQHAKLDRLAPMLDASCDFGVRPWGPEGLAETPDFSGKVASLSANDAVVFTLYNLWVRHDDHSGMAAERHGTHLYLAEVGGESTPAIVPRAALLSRQNGGLAYVLLDLANPQWLAEEEPPRELTPGEFVVWFHLPGLGPGEGWAAYENHLIITD